MGLKMKIASFVFVIVAIVLIIFTIGILGIDGGMNSRFIRRVRIRNLQNWHETITSYIHSNGKMPTSLRIAYGEIKNNRAMPLMPEVKESKLELTPRPLASDQEVEYELVIVRGGWWILEAPARPEDACVFGIDQEGQVFKKTDVVLGK